MSYDEQRISDQIDGGLYQQKQEYIKEFIKKWMDGQEPDTFVKNEHGNYIYSAGYSSLNLVSFFEILLDKYDDELDISLSYRFLKRFQKAAKKQLFALNIGGFGHAEWCTYQKIEGNGKSICNCGVSDLQSVLKDYDEYVQNCS